ncbi:MAG: arylesterase [Magnetococcales bacterium]|nr:arylesterase [Magnetococcales bacterium]
MAAESWKTILCLGDSLTEGFGVADAQCYPRLLQQRLRLQGSAIRVVNAGISGDTTQGVLERLDDLLTTPVDLAIVTIGLNDVFMGYPATIIQDNLETIVQTLQRHPSRVVLSGLRLPSDFPQPIRHEFAALYPRLAAKYHLDLIPFFCENIFEDRAYNQWDNVHPNAAGYRVILETVWKIVQPLLPR